MFLQQDKSIQWSKVTLMMISLYHFSKSSKIHIIKSMSESDVRDSLRSESLMMQIFDDFKKWHRDPIIIKPLQPLIPSAIKML